MVSQHANSRAGQLSGHVAGFLVGAVLGLFAYIQYVKFPPSSWPWGVSMFIIPTAVVLAVSVPIWIKMKPLRGFALGLLVGELTVVAVFFAVLVI